MRTGVEQTRSQKEKAQREESKGDESPPPDAPKPKELERRPVLALGSFSDQAGRVYSICISACVGLPGVGAGPARGKWGLATAPSPLGAAFG